MYLDTFYENKCLPSEVNRLQSQWIGPLQDWRGFFITAYDSRKVI